ncbi:universal stress protein [Gemmobacter sp.]|uniref:universal stress protein n=1 Tax=Gemmobacter sp. TaxID=1898957 RepID=UPI002AFE7993|nr:universal stress protein [Gemmobacter sp.]
MACKTLLTVVTEQGPDGPGMAGLETAIALARREDAHLDVLVLGVDQTQYGYFSAGAGIAMVQETLAQAISGAEDLERKVRQRLATEEIRWAVDHAVAQLGGIAPLVGHRARFVDLVVQARPYGAGRSSADEAVVEAAMFDGQAPVLVMPDGMVNPPAFDRVVVAWNQSPEAMVAIRRALPLLQRAAMVDITVVDPPAHGPERSDPGGMLSQWLSRHDVRAEVSVLARTLPKVSDVLARHIRDRDANLLVMGAYGHSRFREAIMGGATRSMLEKTPVPVLMAR